MQKLNKKLTLQKDTLKSLSDLAGLAGGVKAPLPAPPHTAQGGLTCWFACDAA